MWMRLLCNQDRLEQAIDNLDPPPMPPKNKLTEEQEHAKNELFWLLEDIFKIYGRGDDTSRVTFFINRLILRLDDLPDMLKLGYGMCRMWNLWIICLTVLLPSTRTLPYGM